MIRARAHVRRSHRRSKKTASSQVGEALTVKSVYTGRSAVVQSREPKPVIMKRMSVILAAALLAVAPLEAAAAQDGPRGDRRSGGREQQQRPERERERERPQMSQAEAQRIAQSRAGGARFVGYRGQSGRSYIFAFDDGGRIFNISVDASR